MTSEFVIALHGIVFLKHNDRFLTSDEIAENICTNPARVRKIMTKLKKAGFVETKEGGRKGGYKFIGKPENISAANILNAIEEMPVNMKWRSGSTDMKCVIASGMGNVMDNIEDKLNSACKNVLDEINIVEVENYLLAYNGGKGGINEKL